MATLTFCQCNCCFVGLLLASRPDCCPPIGWPHGLMSSNWLAAWTDVLQLAGRMDCCPYLNNILPLFYPLPSPTILYCMHYCTVLRSCTMYYPPKSCTLLPNHSLSSQVMHSHPKLCTFIPNHTIPIQIIHSPPKSCTPLLNYALPS